MANIDYYLNNNVLTIKKRDVINTIDSNRQFVADAVWDYRNRLGVVESQSDYGRQLDALTGMFAAEAAVGSNTATYLTAQSIGSVTYKLTGVELEAIDTFLQGIDGFVGKIKYANAFTGGNQSASYALVQPLGGGTTTNVGTVTFNSAGAAVLNGSNNLASSLTVANLNSGTAGGLGVYTYNSTGSSTFIGAQSPTAGQFSIGYDGSAAIYARYGSTILLTGSSAYSPIQTYTHVERASGTALSLYVNGTLAGTSTTSTAYTAPSISFAIGANNNNGAVNSYTTGTIGCAIMTDGTLSAANVQTLSTQVLILMGKLGRR